jgi:hypothetical protein
MTDEMNKGNGVESDLHDPMLGPALRDFRASVHAWSDAAHSRPRPVPASAPQTIAWRRPAAWALGVALSLGIFGTAGYERHRQIAIAQERQHQQEQERQRLLEEQRARATEDAQDAEDLMANIDTAVSRQVPAAMEPLALATDENQ